VKNTFWLFNELYLAINFQSTALKHPSTRLRQRWLVKWDLEFEPSDTQSETRTWSDRKWGFICHRSRDSGKTNTHPDTGLHYKLCRICDTRIEASVSYV